VGYFVANGTVDVIVIGDTDSLVQLEVSLQIVHDYVGDLLVELEHVDTASRITLIDRPGEPASGAGCNGNDIDVVLADGATDPVEDECSEDEPTIAGTLRPNEALSTFTGENVAGVWRLTVNDLHVSDEGTLQHWCLVVNREATATPGMTSTNTHTPRRSSTATRAATRIPTPTLSLTPTGTLAPTDEPTAGAPTPTHSVVPSHTTTATPTPTASDSPITPVPVECAGDCDGSGAVTVDELIRGVNIALGNAPVVDCRVLDRDGGGTVTVDELVAAVNNALAGCITDRERTGF
jgi:subtilisin-like proprotein convertase family protein